MSLVLNPTAGYLYDKSKIDYPLTFITSGFPWYTAYMPFTYKLKAGGGAGGYTFADTTGALERSFNSSISPDGVISGRPMRSVATGLRLRVTDAKGNTAEKSMTIRALPLSLNFRLGSPQEIDFDGQAHIPVYEPTNWPDDLPELVAGTDYRVTYSGNGLSNLTEITEPGTYTANISVFKEGCAFGTCATRQINIVDRNPLMILTTTIPEASVYVPFNFQLTAEGGSGQGYVFEEPDNRLAGFGLTLSEDGLLSGTPTKSAMVQSVRFRVTDSNGRSTETRINVRLGALRIEFVIGGTYYVYDGQPHSPIIYPKNPPISLVEGVDYVVTVGGEASQTEVGTYSIKVTMLKRYCTAKSLSQSVMYIVSG